MKMAAHTHEVTRPVDADSAGAVVNPARPVASVAASGDDSAASTARCARPPRLSSPRHADGGPDRLPSVHRVSLRPLRTDDGPALAAAFERLSARSRYRRFHTALPRLTQKMVTYLTEIDHHDHEALVALAPGPGKVIVGVARFIRDPARPDNAEVAVVVADSWKHRGLAMLLLQRLARRAREERIHCLTGYIMTENYPTISLLRALGPSHMECEGSTVTARMDLAVWAVDDLHPVSDDAASYRPARAAAEVALISLAHLVPMVVHVIVAAIAEVITLFWAQAQFVNRGCRRLTVGRFASTTFFLGGAAARVMARPDMDSTSRADPVVPHASLVLLQVFAPSAAYRGIDQLPAAIRVGDRRTCTSTGTERPVLRKEMP